MPIAEARQRLTKEYKNLNKSPLPYITARPNESNILEWHYIIDGPPETPYFNGQYHGVITFTNSYPYAPPLIRMYTPSGRFKPRTRLCLSISDFHPESWNPGWSVSTILTGLLSFMTCEDMTTGSITTSYETKLQCARTSMEYNLLHNPEFVKIFPEYVATNQETLPERLKEIENYQYERRMGKSKLKKLTTDHPPTVAAVQSKKAVVQQQPQQQQEKLVVPEKTRLSEDEIRERIKNKKDPTSFNKFLLAILVLFVGFVLKLFYL